jgi:hypothetical protein
MYIKWNKGLIEKFKLFIPDVLYSSWFKGLNGFSTWNLPEKAIHRHDNISLLHKPG